MVIDNAVKKIDSKLEIYSFRYFLIKKLNRYRKKLQDYKRFTWKALMNYEKRWRKLRKKYDQIYLYGIEFVSIGETMPRLFNLLEDIDRDDGKVLHVVLPTFFDHYVGGIYNRKIFDIFGKKIYFIKDSNIDFWTYIIYFHMHEVQTEMFDQYVSARLGGIKIRPGKPLLPFSKAEIEYGESKLCEMGVKGEFICLYARESNVKTVDFGKRQGYESRYRNCDISTFYKTGRYFRDRNVQSVRIGKYETQKLIDKDIIDYANMYYDEFMDFYLLSRCKFLVACDGGMTVVCGNWGRPVLLTNAINLCYGWECWPDTGYDMYIPKRFFSRREKRYLNLYEMLDVMNECGIYASNFIKRGIVLEDNTEDEILEASVELEARLKNLWEETEIEKSHYEKYWRILRQWESEHSYVVSRKKSGFAGYTMCFNRLSYNYLKNNLYLLDNEGSFKRKDVC